MAELVKEVIKGNCEQFSDCRSITEVGSETCYVTVQEAHDMIERDPQVFYVEDGHRRIHLVAVYDAKWNLKYVRTSQVDTSEDPLLQLPEARESTNLEMARPSRK